MKAYLPWLYTGLLGAGAAALVAMAVHQAGTRQADLAVRLQQINERLGNLDGDMLQARMNIDLLQRRADLAFSFQTNASAEMELLHGEILHNHDFMLHLNTNIGRALVPPRPPRLPRATAPAAAALQGRP